MVCRKPAVDQSISFVVILFVDTAGLVRSGGLEMEDHFSKTDVDVTGPISKAVVDGDAHRG